MSEGEVRSEKIRALREALGDYSDSFVTVVVGPDGRLATNEVGEEGVTAGTATWFDPATEQEAEEADDGEP